MSPMREGLTKHFEGETLLNETVTLHLRWSDGKATVRYGLRTDVGSGNATKAGRALRSGQGRPDAPRDPPRLQEGPEEPAPAGLPRPPAADGVTVEQRRRESRRFNRQAAGGTPRRTLTPCYRSSVGLPMPRPLAGIDRFPRVALAHTPTPLEPAPRSASSCGSSGTTALGSPRGATRCGSWSSTSGRRRRGAPTRCSSPGRCSRTSPASRLPVRESSAWTSTSNWRIAWRGPTVPTAVRAT